MSHTFLLDVDKTFRKTAKPEFESKSFHFYFKAFVLSTTAYYAVVLFHHKNRKNKKNIKKHKEGWAAFLCGELGEHLGWGQVRAEVTKCWNTFSLNVLANFRHCLNESDKENMGRNTAV